MCVIKEKKKRGENVIQKTNLIAEINNNITEAHSNPYQTSMMEL